MNGGLAPCLKDLLFAKITKHTSSKDIDHPVDDRIRVDEKLLSGFKIISLCLSGDGVNKR